MNVETDAHFQIELVFIGDLQDTLRNLTELAVQRPEPVEYNLIRTSRLEELQSISSQKNLHLEK